MKKIILFAALAICLHATATVTNVNTIITALHTAAKIDIKIKNDSGDEVTVYNAGSGGTYRLQKNITTTIKMEAGDKLYRYENGKKGALLLTAAADMDGKVQLLSKL
jgi:hypothetical protein